jgi:hypothetical protein
LLDKLLLGHAVGGDIGTVRTGFGTFLCVPAAGGPDGAGGQLRVLQMPLRLGGHNAFDYGAIAIFPLPAAALHTFGAKAEGTFQLNALAHFHKRFVNGKGRFDKAHRAIGIYHAQQNGTGVRCRTGATFVIGCLHTLLFQAGQFAQCLTAKLGEVGRYFHGFDPNAQPLLGYFVRIQGQTGCSSGGCHFGFKQMTGHHGIDFFLDGGNLRFGKLYIFEHYLKFYFGHVVNI